MTLEEQIQAGIVPGSDPESEIPSGSSELTELQKQELEAEVIYDWDHLAAGVVRAKRAQNKDYSDALDRVTENTYPGCPVTATFNKTTGQYSFEGGVDAPPADEPVIAAAPDVVAPLAAVPDAPAQDPNSPFVKTAEGFEIRIDLNDGGGVQVFKGRTEAEATRKLAKGQANATREIRRRNKEREVLAEAADQSQIVRTPGPAPLSVDEVFTLTQQLQDPATAVKAHKRLLEAQLGMTTDDFRNEWERQRQASVAKRWVATTPGFYNDPDAVNATLIGKYFETHNLEVNEKNLGTVFNVLKSKGALLEAPEFELPEPTAAPVAAVPAPVVPAAVPAPAKNPAAAAVPAQPAGRLRPGSASTGASPRQSSVRSGASAGAVVGLTAEEYRKLPVSEVKQRYKSDPGFRSGVDKLIAEGKI